jgi:uncharacterized protein (DUF433 family)
MNNAKICEREYYNSPDPTQKWRCRERFVPTSKNYDVPFAQVLSNALVHYPHIAVDENVVCGVPRIAGTRIPVYMVLSAIQHHGNLDGAIISYPQLKIEQVKEAVRYAAEVLEYPFEYESQATA